MAEGFRFGRRDETLTSAMERSGRGLATVRSPLLAHAAPKAAQALWTNTKIWAHFGGVNIPRPAPEPRRVDAESTDGFPLNAFPQRSKPWEE
jgi:hypothetical protein